MKIQKIVLLIIIMIFFIKDIFGQTTGKVDYKYLGLSFIIPEGWIGREVEKGYLIGHNTIPGFAFLFTHQEKSIDAIRVQAQQGIQDENGTALTLSSALSNFGQNGIGGEYTGTLEGSPVKAYIISLISPYGSGINIMAASSQTEYNQVHRELAEKLAEHVKFTKPEVSPVMMEWKKALSNAKLTYMDSYYSSGAATDGGYTTGGGYSDKKIIDLCAQGFFKYKSSSQTNIDVGGAFANSSGKAGGDGNWEIIGNAQGGAVLRLNFNNGEVYEYSLTNQGSDIYLNGKKYYRTFGNGNDEYTPDCF